MNNNLTFQQSIADFVKSSIDVSRWKTAQTHFENKMYADAIRACINYINPEIETKYANADKTIYDVPHGSVIVHIQITETHFSVKAPFLNIQDAKVIPVLRQVAQLNFHPLKLSSIILEDKQLYFYFECSLPHCEPYKVYDVLREICINADNYDDEFISKFNAVHVQEPKIYPYAPNVLQHAWNTVQLYIEETLAAYEQLENKRLTAYLWDVLAITLLKLDYFCVPQGYLRVELEKAIANLNSKEDYYQRLSSTKTFLKEIQSMDSERFGKSLYRIEIFVPYKFRTDLDGVRNMLQYAYETAEKELKASDYLGAVFTLEYGILNLFYNHQVAPPIEQLLSGAMIQSSQKTIQETANTLYDTVKKVMETDVTQATSTPKTENKSFFGKLFKK